MTWKSLFSLCLIFVLSGNVYAINKAIYGDDSRIDLMEHDNIEYKRWGFSTLAMIPEGAILQLPEPNGEYSAIFGTPFSEAHKLCKGERFYEQRVSASCSGFLIAQDLVATAGHCVETLADCQANKWVFDFRQETAYPIFEDSDETAVFVQTSSVYGCKEIVKRKLGGKTDTDFAVIRLDRPVLDRYPLPIRQEGKVAEGTELIIVGHPSGLPAKLAEGAVVKGNKKESYFTAALDAFGGNSGSAVFDANTGLVEGILVRGLNDFSYKLFGNCYKASKYAEWWRPADVCRITEIFKSYDEKLFK